MELFLGLLMLFIGLYLYNKQLRKDKAGISIFNMYWKSERFGLVYVLILGGLAILLRLLVFWVISLRV